MLLGFALGLERPRLAGVLGICLSLVGVGFIVYGGLEFAGTSLVGDALILAAAVFWGSYTVLSLGLLERYPPISLAAYSMILGGLVAFPLSLFDPHTLDPAAIDSTTWTAAAYSMLFSSAFGFAAWGSGVSRVGANRGPIHPYLVTPHGATASALLCSRARGSAAWGSGVSRVGANRVLIYQYLVTLIGVSAGIVLLGESFGPGQLIGAAVIVAGVYLAKR